MIGAVMSEILAPAGDAQSFYAALNAGADAIYLGLTDFSARKSAENFTLSNLSQFTDRAHLFGVKVYVALNTLVKDAELPSFFSCAREAWNAGADALIIQDIFLGKILHKCYPEIVLHLSTQAGVCNVYGARLAKRYGFSRVILARETPIEDISEIAKILETEVFVQGALCTCFSGQCYMSSFAGGNSGNRGFCKQPCRKKYSIDGNKKEKLAYRLSLSDLCVGEQIRPLIQAGVCSFKIEGRMRSPSYVSASVRYYRDLLDEKGAPVLKQDFSDLKRTFNRGNYTLGYSFGQDKNLISSEVQGHIGERVGKVSLLPQKGAKEKIVTKHEKLYFVKSSFCPSDGDGFKVLRQGQEVGGGVWRSYFPLRKDGFYLGTKNAFSDGDEVCITSDTALQKKLLQRQRKISLHLSCKLQEGNHMTVRVQKGEKEFTFTAPFLAEKAKSHPFTQADFVSCFSKADEFPFETHFEQSNITGDFFIVKSALNAFRREVFSELYKQLLPYRVQLEERPLPVVADVKQKNPAGIAVIDRNFSSSCYGEKVFDYAVFRPTDVKNIASIQDFLQNAKYYARHKLLFIPAFCTGEDIKNIKSLLPLFDGIYSDGVFAIELSRETGVLLFAGSGFNLFNPISAAVAQQECEEVCLSKELSEKELSVFDKSFYRFSGGSVQLMELGHCPFSMKCAECEDRDTYTMTDDAGRKFYLLRFKNSRCRFSVYNMLPMVSGRKSGVFDFTALTDEQKQRFLSEDTEGMRGAFGVRSEGIR